MPIGSVSEHRAFERTSPFHRSAATVVATIFIVLTLGAVPIAAQRGPDLHYIVAMSAIAWTIADLLTGLLLLGEFYLSGRIYYAVASFVFGTVGLLSIAYLAYFPSVIGQVRADSFQLSPWLFVFRSVFFATALGTLQLRDPSMRERVRPGSGSTGVLIGVFCATSLVATLIVVACVAGRAHLPVLVTVNASRTDFTSAFTARIMPAIFVLTLAAIVVFARRARTLGVLQLWLLVSLVAAACDAAMDVLAPARSSVGWYVATFDTIGSAFSVFAILLFEVVAIYARLTNQSRLDPLTALRNRRSFDDEFAWAIEEAQSRNSALALLSIDIDDFKRYNDRYGHPAGDVTLQRVASAIDRATRHGDHISARYGGEEFVVLLPELDASGAHLVAERLRAAIEELAIPHLDANGGRVTVSIGAASVAPPFLSRRLLVDTADAALYEAKRRGRNLVCSDAPEGSALTSVHHLRRA